MLQPMRYIAFIIRGQKKSAALFPDFPDIVSTGSSRAASHSSSPVNIAGAGDIFFQLAAKLGRVGPRLRLRLFEFPGNETPQATVVAACPSKPSPGASADAKHHRPL